MRSIKIVMPLFLFLLISVVNAQDFIIGIKYGNGKDLYKRIDKSDRSSLMRLKQYGISLAYSPYYSKLSIESSIEFEKNDSASYLYFPLGFRIALGKRLRPFFEGGVYSSILKDSNTRKFMMKNDFGARLGIGVLYALNKRWRVEGGYYKRYGFGSPLIYKRQQPGDTYTTEKYRFSAYNIELALKYRF
jgi:opacity protein-like surface antigen